MSQSEGYRASLFRLCLVGLVAGLGCHAATPRVDKNPPTPGKTLSASSGIKPEGSGSKTDFRAKVEPAQEVGVHLDMGRGFEGQGQLDAAALEYQKALEVLERPGRDPQSSRSIADQKATAHRRLAGVLDRQGRFAQSDAHYKAAIKLAPGDPKVWNNAGYSYYIQARWDDAEQALRTAHRLAPDDPKVATNLGLALAGQGKEDEAYRLLSKAGGEASAHQNIAFVLASTGRTDRAADRYRKALALQPDLAPPKAALAKLGATTPSLLADAPTDPSLAKAVIEKPAAKRHWFGKSTK